MKKFKMSLMTTFGICYDLKKYLPKYLSEENYKTLLAELKSFPYNIDGRMYTSMLDKNVIFQGDGLKKCL